MSDTRTAEKRAVTKAERKRFERWMKRYWGGIGLSRFEAADEYEGHAAQVAWEVWRRFTVLPMVKK